MAFIQVCFPTTANYCKVHTHITTFELGKSQKSLSTNHAFITFYHVPSGNLNNLLKHPDLDYVVVFGAFPTRISHTSRWNSNLASVHLCPVCVCVCMHTSPCHYCNLWQHLMSFQHWHSDAEKSQHLDSVDSICLAGFLKSNVDWPALSGAIKTVIFFFITFSWNCINWWKTIISLIFSKQLLSDPKTLNKDKNAKKEM